MAEQTRDYDRVLPIFFPTESVFAQEVQADDAYFVSPAEYRRIMMELFDKVTAKDLENAKARTT